MIAKGCFHLQAYKKNYKNLDNFKWIHAVFVVGITLKTHKTKIDLGNELLGTTNENNARRTDLEEFQISNTYCRTCKKRGPFLHACLECVYFGCHKHIREHTKHQKHVISMDITYGQIHCYSCNDYIYDAEIDSISMQNKMQAGTFKKRLFECTSWNPTGEERDLLECKTKKICITPESTVGLRGLLNLGSTCFMNCIVQALMHTPLLRDYFLTERHKCNGERGTCLVCEVSKLFQEFYKGTRVPLALHGLLHLIWTHARHLAGYEQQDAHEFFIATLDLLHQHCRDTMPYQNITGEKNAKKCPCIIDQIFTGGLQSDVVCQKCKGVSTTIDPIWDFSLDLGPISLDGRPPSSLIDCLERFTRAEYLGSKSKILCTKCESYEESTKQLTMKTLPIVVSFHLKRFQHSEEMSKISTVVSFPEMLDMTPFMSRSKKESPFPSDNRYSLFAVINHKGSIDKGHYIAFVRQQQDYWYKCNDDLITNANLQEVLNTEGYLLFYHKQVLEYE